MGLFFKSRQQKEAEFLAPQYIRHIEETTTILNSTTNPDTFFSRYDFLIERINNLISIQKYLKFNGETPKELLCRLNSSRTSDFNDFIERFYHETINQIDKLKTLKAKQKRIDNFKPSLSTYFKNMGKENIQKVEELDYKLKNYINKSLDDPNNNLIRKEANVTINNELASADHLKWYIMISFGKSTSTSHEKAVYLAKNSPSYHEKIDENGNITHTATYSSSKKDFLDFVVLYDLVASWKSTFFIINGEITDKKTIGKIKYCYGDKCRSVKSNFCYGASYMTVNPFGCHRLQISAANNPWWKYYEPEGGHYKLNRESIIERIKLTANTFKYCPAFDIENIMSVAMSFPLILKKREYEELVNKETTISMHY